MARAKPDPTIGYIRMDGADPDFVYFSTYSWSRPWADIRHDIVVDRRDWTISCSCEDSTYRGRVGELLGKGPNDQPNACKHQRELVRWFADYMERLK